jgi:hypothetical protein
MSVHMNWIFILEISQHTTIDYVIWVNLIFLSIKPSITFTLFDVQTERVKFLKKKGKEKETTRILMQNVSK